MRVSTLWNCGLITLLFLTFRLVCPSSPCYPQSQGWTWIRISRRRLRSTRARSQPDPLRFHSCRTLLSSSRGKPIMASVCLLGVPISRPNVRGTMTLKPREKEQRIGSFLFRRHWRLRRYRFKSLLSRQHHYWNRGRPIKASLRDRPTRALNAGKP
jgi:hypothetical protein